MFRYISFLLLLSCFVSCRPDVFPPKPSGYFRIDTPATHQYRVFDEPGFPYSFEYPVYSTIVPDTIFQHEKTKNPYWINISIPGLGGVINITYKEITAAEPFAKLQDEAYGISFLHHEKADYITPSQFYHEAAHVSGTLYTVGGDAASRYQFTATDSVKHFLHGSLYFDVTPNADSLKPATDFLERDIEHIMATLQWKG